MIGTTISHYIITGKLGEGGMGVVYKAEDTKLERPVALKFLAAHLLSNEEAKKRFMREAKAAGALDHPNICTLYEIDEANGRTFLAMAYLEGRTLEKMISEGPLRIEDVLDIGTQIAKGLQKAHGKGIHHRDIKPSNLVLVDETPKERLVKIMDFGMAQLVDQSRLTLKDTALGTPAYMSPEQAQGVPVDQRTDIWSLGVVLYEMVVARMPFKGEYQQAVFYNLMNEDYEPLTGIRTGVPMDLEFIVAKCLAKDAAQRYQSAGDVIIDLAALREKLASKKSAIARKVSPASIGAVQRPAREPAAGAAVATGSPAGPTQAQHTPPPESQDPTPDGGPEPQRGTAGALRHGTADPRVAGSTPRAPRRAPWIVAALATAVALAFGVLFFSLETPPPPRSIVSTILPPEDVRRIDDLALSSDGEWLTFAALPAEGEPRLYLRRLDSPDTRSLDGTEGASYPFWSPDSRFIGFFADGKLKKTGISGGSPFTLADAPEGRGGAWSEDGVIVFAPNIFDALHRVAAGGGPVSEVTELDAEGGQGSHRWPWFLPDGRRFLFHSSRSGSGDQTSAIYLGSLDGEPPTSLMPAGSNAVFSAGHLLFANQDTLLVRRFKAATATLHDEPQPLVGGVVRDALFSRGKFSAAADGRLAYLPRSGATLSKLVWFERSGERLDAVGDPGDFRDVALSPDETTAAVAVQSDLSGQDLWLYDLARNLRTRFTFAPENDITPVWSPDGEDIAFASNRNGTYSNFRKAVSGLGKPQLLVDSGPLDAPRSWSPDGRLLLFVSLDPLDDLWILPLDAGGGHGEPEPYLRTEFSERDGQFSPDGRWVAYMSDESGRYEVYVAPFPNPTGRVQVSTDGGAYPLWRGDGKEVFYRTEDGSIMAAEVEAADTRFRVGALRRLFQVNLLPGYPYFRKYDVTADGQKFLVIEVPESETKPVIMLDSNWPAHLSE